ncbi:MAG: hypothetical protein GXP36_09810 [Actinobacteria bacterium]|nr:hypothetical protein [Actinomycetota bacterium]
MEHPDRLLAARDLAEYHGVPAPRFTDGGIAESGSADPSPQAQFRVVS